MNKENNRSAAGLRRSAIAERIRLREEWSELKGTPDVPLTARNGPVTRVLPKKTQATRHNVNRRPVGPSSSSKRNVGNKNVINNTHMPSEALAGVVALVEVGAEPRALALRAALGALGATVVPAWSPIVTHVVWTQGGCRATRAKARALASRLVSPLWVEACAASNKRLPEQAFPAAARASDLPSPRALRQLLKKAEMENIPLVDLLSDDKDSDQDNKAPRLRMSSETELDTSEDKTADTSRDTSHDTSRDTTRDTSRDKTDVAIRVNTAPRRAMPVSTSPTPPARSRRKLFTHKEAEDTKTKASDDDTDAEPTTVPGRIHKAKLPLRPTASDRKELARAERLARRLVAACAPAQHTQQTDRKAPRIVLTGMGRAERATVAAAVRALGGRLQARVTRRTTHVLLGSCREDGNGTLASGVPTTNGLNITGVTSLDDPRVVHRSDVLKARTLSALAGAARGCRVLRARWAEDSRGDARWLHHHGYEVPHLKKVSQKARIERTALCRMRSDYALDVFSGMRVRLTPRAEQRDAAAELIRLCGGVVVEASGDCDMTIGVGDGEVSSKWVFDSVAAGRMRTARRYVNNALSGTVLAQTNR